MATPTDVQAARWSKFISGSQQFQLNNAPSGATGAVARDTLSLDNFPNAMVALRVAFSFEGLPDANIIATPGIYEAVQRMAEDCTIRIAFAQQGLTQEPAHLRNFQGPTGSLRPIPLPLPHYLRGANQCRVELTRLSPMLTFDNVQVIPTAYFSLVGVSLMSDLAPPAPPGSSGYP